MLNIDEISLKLVTILEKLLQFPAQHGNKTIKINKIL